MNKGLKPLLIVDPRTVFRGEATEFTPWLAEPDNIALIGEALGIELECQSQEQPIGQFRADILCKDINTGSQVLIENQLTRSDHGHLGQLLTYAAWLNAEAIIWVAPEFCREHVNALKWLNGITADRFRFFVVKFELLQISAVKAPRFTVVLGPDDRVRPRRKPSQGIPPKVTESARRRREYWQEFLGAALRLNDPQIRVPTANTLGNLWFGLRGRDLWITVYAASSLGRIGVFLRGKPEYQPKLKAKRRDIEAELGTPVGWNLDHDQWSVAVSREADPTHRQDWPRQHKWLALQLNRFIRVFKPFV
jgi:hypothetical protein